ncbi:hypothetical protein LJB42_002787 [Komagataella kurtzmanii]|nr:hypothetical protein LJB42_002787 [Komagataella kurtzmanii]
MYNQYGNIEYLEPMHGNSNGVLGHQSSFQHAAGLYQDLPLDQNLVRMSPYGTVPQDPLLSVSHDPVATIEGPPIGTFQNNTGKSSMQQSPLGNQSGLASDQPHQSLSQQDPNARQKTAFNESPENFKASQIQNPVGTRELTEHPHIEQSSQVQPMQQVSYMQSMQPLQGYQHVQPTQLADQSQHVQFHSQLQNVQPSYPYSVFSSPQTNLIGVTEFPPNAVHSPNSAVPYTSSISQQHSYTDTLNLMDMNDNATPLVPFPEDLEDIFADGPLVDVPTSNEEGSSRSLLDQSFIFDFDTSNLHDEPLSNNGLGITTSKEKQSSLQPLAYNKKRVVGPMTLKPNVSNRSMKIKQRILSDSSVLEQHGIQKFDKPPMPYSMDVSSAESSPREKSSTSPILELGGGIRKNSIKPLRKSASQGTLTQSKRSKMKPIGERLSFSEYSSTLELSGMNPNLSNQASRRQFSFVIEQPNRTKEKRKINHSRNSSAGNKSLPNWSDAGSATTSPKFDPSTIKHRTTSTESSPVTPLSATVSKFQSLKTHDEVELESLPEDLPYHSDRKKSLSEQESMGISHQPVISSFKRMDSHPKTYNTIQEGMNQFQVIINKR